MARPSSADLRERVLLACEQGEGRRAAMARRFRVGDSTVYAWLQVARLEGRREAKPHAGGPPPKLDAAGPQILKELVLEHTDATLVASGDPLAERTGCHLGTASLCRTLHQLKLRRKKRPCGQVNGTART